MVLAVAVADPASLRHLDRAGPRLARLARRPGVNGPFGPHPARSMGPPGPCRQALAGRTLVLLLRHLGGDQYLGIYPCVNGTYTPLCLSWLVTANNTYTLYYIKLSLVTHDWSEISSAELSTC
jgi:hypothetical protein